MRNKIQKAQLGNNRYNKKAKRVKSINKADLEHITQPVHSNLKALPAIVTASNATIDEYATSHRYKSFDRGKRKVNQSTLLPSPVNKIGGNFRNERLLNKSVDELSSTFDPLNSFVKLNKFVKSKNSDAGHKLDPISCPISPTPFNKELWPRNVKNGNQIVTDFTSSPRSILVSYRFIVDF